MTSIIEVHPGPAPTSALPPPPASGAAVRAELTALIASGLYRRVDVNARERELIPVTAEITADLAHLTKIFRHGRDPRDAVLLLNGIKLVARGLCLIGTHRVADTVAERILIDALAVQNDALAVLPSAGTA